jgi:hypothetical protein
MNVHGRYSPASNWLAIGLMLGLIGVSPLGCSSLGGPGTKIHQSSQGTVYLEEASDWSFEAGHPTVIDPATIAAALRGVVIEAPPAMPHRGSAGAAKPARVFSDEDVAFLAPLLAQGLLHAKPEHLVVFRVNQPTTSGAEPTSGLLYVQKGSLYLALTHYHGEKWKSADVQTRIGAIGFLPETAARIETAAAIGHPDLTSLAIDYRFLAKNAPLTAIPAKAVPAKPEPMPVAAAMPVSMPDPLSASPAAAPRQDQKDVEFLTLKLEELRQAKEALDAKDGQIKTMKKEVDSLRRQLVEREAEIKALKAKGVSAKLPQKKAAKVTKK